MDLVDAIAAGGRPLVEGWLDMALMAALPESEDDDQERWQFKLAAARAAVEALAGPDAPVAARMQAVLYVIAHAAAIEQQAHANSRYLAPEVRKTAQRFALQLMNAAARNLAALERLRAKGRGTDRKTEKAAPNGAARPESPERRRPSAEAPERPAAMEAPPPAAPPVPPEPAPNRRMRRAAARAARRAIAE